MDFFKRSDTVKILKNFDMEPMSWQEIIDNLNFTINNQIFFKRFENYGFVTHNGYIVSKCQNILNIIKNCNLDFPSKALTAHIYTSFTSSSGTFDMHIDKTTDVWFWQCIGITKWEFEINNKIYEEFLYPKDIIFIPKGTPHKTTPISPRSGVSFGIEHDKKDYNIEDY